MYEIGAILGGLVPTFLVRGIFLLLIPQTTEAPVMRALIANILSGLVTIGLYAVGSANGGPVDWSSGWFYLVSQGVWLVVDVIRGESKKLALQSGISAKQTKTPHSRPSEKEAFVDGKIAQAQKTEPTTGELTFWQSIQNSSDAADFEAYLAQFPAGLFRSLAQNRLASLRKQ